MIEYEMMEWMNGDDSEELLNKKWLIEYIWWCEIIVSEKMDWLNENNGDEWLTKKRCNDWMEMIVWNYWIRNNGMIERKWSCEINE